ncbi:MAG: hypothetical protein COA78_37855 [Blastopirellula sp.]|nr:MAG: hypothetical protein COA78_37855 [Blastopirellula sp.]
MPKNPYPNLIGSKFCNATFDKTKMATSSSHQMDRSITKDYINDVITQRLHWFGVILIHGPIHLNMDNLLKNDRYHTDLR